MTGARKACRGFRSFSLSVCAIATVLSAGCESETASPELANPIETVPEPAISIDVAMQELGCNAERATQVFAQCKVCHSASAGEKNLTGPNLHAIVGRPAAAMEGFAYSKVIRESGIVWDVKVLDEFLANPQAYLPNNRMAFGGVTNDEDREAVICLLSALK